MFNPVRGLSPPPRSDSQIRETSWRSATQRPVAQSFSAEKVTSRPRSTRRSGGSGRGPSSRSLSAPPHRRTPGGRCRGRRRWGETGTCTRRASCRRPSWCLARGRPQGRQCVVDRHSAVDTALYHVHAVFARQRVFLNVRPTSIVEQGAAGGSTGAEDPDREEKQEGQCRGAHGKTAVGKENDSAPFTRMPCGCCV